MKLKDLTGHSGCKVELYDKNGRFVVKKTSKSTTYNCRLHQQCLKQIKYKNQFFCKPQVYSFGYDNDLFVFEMEYINGIGFHEYFRTLDISKIKSIAELLIQNIISLSPGAKVSNKKILQKIEYLNNKIRQKNNNITNAIELLKNFKWDLFYLSDCHGDLTFENIIYRNNSFYLIDFLDSFTSSWLIDIAKLLQDFEIYWSYRYSTIDENIKLRCHLMKNLIINEILLMENGQSLVITIYHILLLNLLRIIPYIENRPTAQLVDYGIKKTITIINQLIKDYGYGYANNTLRWKVNKIPEYEAQMAANASRWPIDD